MASKHIVLLALCLSWFVTAPAMGSEMPVYCTKASEGMVVDEERAVPCFDSLSSSSNDGGPSRSVRDHEGYCGGPLPCGGEGNPNELALFDIAEGKHMCCLPDHVPGSGTCCEWPLGQCSGSENGTCCPYCPDGEQLCWESRTEVSCAAEGQCSGSFERPVDSDPGGGRLQDLDGFEIFLFCGTLLLAIKGIKAGLLENLWATTVISTKDVLWQVLYMDQHVKQGAEKPLPELPRSLFSRRDGPVGGKPSVFSDSLNSSVFTSLISIMFTVLRIYEFNFLWCQTEACRVISGACVFALLDICVQQAFSISYGFRTQATYVTGTFGKIISTFVDLCTLLFNIGWLAYEMASMFSSVNGTGTLILFVVTFEFSVHIFISTFRTNFRGRKGGYHSLMSNPVMPHKFPLAIGMVSELPENQRIASLFRRRVQMQDAMRAGAKAEASGAQDCMGPQEAVEPVINLDLEGSDVLKACGWREYIERDDIDGLFAKVKEVTDQRGNLKLPDGTSLFDPLYPSIRGVLKLFSKGHLELNKIADGSQGVPIAVPKIPEELREHPIFKRIAAEFAAAVKLPSVQPAAAAVKLPGIQSAAPADVPEPSSLGLDSSLPGQHELQQHQNEVEEAGPKEAWVDKFFLQFFHRKGSRPGTRRSLGV